MTKKSTTIETQITNVNRKTIGPPLTIYFICLLCEKPSRLHHSLNIINRAKSIHMDLIFLLACSLACAAAAAAMLYTFQFVF